MSLNELSKNLAVYFGTPPSNQWHFSLSGSVEKEKLRINDLGFLHDRGYAFSDDAPNYFARFPLIPFMQYAG